LNPKKRDLFYFINNDMKIMNIKNTKYKHPLISVIVITYNQEDTIARTLESILSQKLDIPFEIVIGEDSSSDRTPQICNEFQNRYHNIIRVFHNTKNKGIRDNYYDCLLQCKGKYIADCAGDDFWIDNRKLQKQYDILEKHPEVSLVHTGWKYYDTSSQTYKDSDATRIRERFLKPFMDKGELLIPILRRDAPIIIHLCTSLYRRDIFINEYIKDTELFRNPDFTCEDIQLEAIMAAERKIAYIPDITLAYSVGHKSATSGESFEKNFNFYFGTLKLNLYLQKKYKIPSDSIQPYYDTLIQYLWSQIFYSGITNRIEEFKNLISAIKYHSTWKTHLYRIALKQKDMHNLFLKLYNFFFKR